MLELKEYVDRFTRAFRSEANKLPEHEKKWIGDLWREQCLSATCQIHVFELHQPYLLFWIFLLDETQPDLEIFVHKTNSKDVSLWVGMLRRKHAKLQADWDRIAKIIARTIAHLLKLKHERCLYSIDGVQNALVIALPYDPRIGPRAYAPEILAETIFNLNYTQGVDRTL